MRPWAVPTLLLSYFALLLSLRVVVGWSLWTQITAGSASCSCSWWVWGAQDWETTHQSVIDWHQRSRIIKFSAVVWRAENSHELASAEEFISVFYHLMGPTYEVNVVFLEELLDNMLTKRVGHTSIVLSPARLSLLWVWPEQVTKQSVLWHFSRSRDLLELWHSNELRGETAVHAEDFVINQCCYGHAIEDVLELFPDANWVATLALVIETVDTVDLAALVVTSQQKEVLLELDLVGQQQDNGLKWVFAAIDVVAKEQVVGLGWEASILEETEEIWELSVSITWTISKKFALSICQTFNLILIA